MNERYRTELSFDGSESFVLDDGREGETVCVFVRKNHAEEAQKLADQWNREEAPARNDDLVFLLMMGAAVVGVVLYGIFLGSVK